MCVRGYACVCVCIFVCMCVYVYTCAWCYITVRMSSFQLHVCMYVCAACDCDVRGTKGGAQSCQQEGRSEGGLGQCPCKNNVDLQTCSECKDEYYGLDSNNPEGCSGECVCTSVCAYVCMCV